jgi:hypothetical protein
MASVGDANGLALTCDGDFCTLCVATPPGIAGIDLVSMVTPLLRLRIKQQQLIDPIGRPALFQQCGPFAFVRQKALPLRQILVRS